MIGHERKNNFDNREIVIYIIYVEIERCRERKKERKRDRERERERERESGLL